MPKKTVKSAETYELNSNLDTFTFSRNKIFRLHTQPATTCSNLTIETLKQKVKHVRRLYC